MSFVGENIIYKATCGSTNTEAMKLLSAENVPEGTVIITDNQTNGRGQRANTWTSEPYKNLTFSLILYPTWVMIQNSFLLNMLTAISIYKTLNTYIPNGLFVKWPNDIYYQNKKIGGVLIENLINQNKIKTSIIGIGLNINQTTFSLTNITSLSLVCGHEFNLSSLLTQLTDTIQTEYVLLAQGEIDILQKDYLAALYWVYEQRTFQDKAGYFQGVIQGVDAIGRLVVQKENGQIAYYECKEITFIA
ncbi:biotin--[acetyl-CoA-carboxylase] ligase [Candidatus Amoebophilus asiaticus]|nr:biotin--[acetyl-CoA-carboxylase] ligase [Candidatus Amoebophilus asiaticus]